MPVLNAIKRENPDLIILLGDNIYVDSSATQVTGCGCFCQWYKVQYNPPDEYKRLLSHPDLPKIDITNTDDNAPTWLATWDDHDYGGNNFDATW
eukprot:CAMPEP_0114656210 /NCGR_PEP_ID=MMETSP0191-20121206/11965_1 /TAXON_ID=126664 /ORGANISM="Sorites sp." /LENGTH=93 /DNA_ID=CAMNT_0001872895 /DNA_START=1732 /DNA_END=2010 /DNA_ORIENTATION=-